MKILINDYFDTQVDYMNIFKGIGYEKNELIFRNNFQDTKEFISEYLGKKKQHVDLIVTNKGVDLKCDELLSFRNFLCESYSNGNFFIPSIPIVLYSATENHTMDTLGFDAVVEKNSAGNHDYFINRSETLIRHWRNALLDDLETLGIRLNDLYNFPRSKGYKEYQKKVLPRVDSYFSFRTKVVSREFISCPSPLEYDWLTKTTQTIETPLFLFTKTLKGHKRYNRKVNERTVWHRLFLDNPLLITRDAYNGYHYEKNLNESKKGTSKECDFILTTEFPDLLSTTFLEVKREDKQYYVKKRAKVPQWSAGMFSDLKQLWGYKKYNEDTQYFEERTRKITYHTQNLDYTLLAGSKDEKEEMQALFDSDMNDHFPGIQVSSFEDFGNTYENYVNKFERLRVKLPK